MADRWSKTELLELSARGLGKVDLHGERGITQVTAEEIAAMAGLLAVMGLSPIRPGEKAPENPERLIQYRFEGEMA
jgi:hypothetical protein